MKRSSRHTLLTALLFTAGCAHLSSPSATGESCRAELEALVGLVQRNYSGWDDKQRLHAQHIAKTTGLIRQSSVLVQSETDCTSILHDWLDTVGDRHLGLRPHRIERLQQSLQAEPIDLEPRVTFVDADAVVVKLPSFGANFTAAITQLIEHHRDEITQRRTLVIDLRGNGGGSDASWRSLLPYVLTGPVTTAGNDVLVTPESVSSWEWLLASQVPLEHPERSRLEERIVAMKRRLMTAQPPPPPLGSIWMPFAASGIITPSEILTPPDRIVLVVDSQCASACEELLVTAQSSAKVLTVGTRTTGALDYSNLVVYSLPSGKRHIQVPTTRTRRDWRVDDAGITPCVVVPAVELKDMSAEELATRFRDHKTCSRKAE